MGWGRAVAEGRRTFRAVEGLRGWLAWWVLVGHIVNLTGVGTLLHPRLAFFLVRGDLAVAAFMVVSGFVITHLLIEKHERYAPYILRRACRLFPIFLIVLLLSLATRDLFEVAFIENTWTTGRAYRLERLAAEERHWIIHLLLHLTMLHGAVPDSVLKYANTALLAPGWSLSLEWQFYLVAPIVVAAMMAPRLRTIGLLALLLLLYGAGVHGWLGVWMHPSFLPMAVIFFFGGISSRLLLERRIPWFALCVTAIAVVLRVQVGFLWSLANLAIVGGVWLPVLVLAARDVGKIGDGGVIGRRLAWLVYENPLIAALGQVSYSTYLVHIPVLAVVLGVAIRLTGRIDRPAIFGFALLALPIIVAVSFLLYHYVEKPGIRLGKWLVQQFFRQSSIEGPEPMDGQPVVR